MSIAGPPLLVNGAWNLFWGNTEVLENQLKEIPTLEKVLA
jgi:hypothetical protein